MYLPKLRKLSKKHQFTVYKIKLCIVSMISMKHNDSICLCIWSSKALYKQNMNPNRENLDVIDEICYSYVHSKHKLLILRSRIIPIASPTLEVIKEITV